MRRVLPLLLLLAPTIASAAPRTFAELMDLITNLINGGIGVALILGIVVFFFGTATSMAKTIKGDTTHMRSQLLWGIIALFVMFSVWGILALLRNTLFGGGAGAGLGGGSGGAVMCETFEDCEILD